MPFRSARHCFFSILTLCLFTLAATRADADTVGLSDGKSVSGTIVLFATSSGAGLDNAVSWSLNSSETPFPLDNPFGTHPNWSNTNNLGIAFGSFTGPAGAYTTFGTTNNTLDATGTGIQSGISFAVAGTFSQFLATLNNLAVGQSIQLSLLTLDQGNCSVGECSEEIDSAVLNGNLGSQQIEYMTGPSYITITNDPGVYDITVTSTPLSTTPTPEPASLLLIGIGLATAALLRRLLF